MQIVTSVADVRDVRWSDSKLTWGLVPTMGALHAGHLSLITRARAENGRVGVSIFINPTQFNNPDDLIAYPRDLDGDLEKLEAAGVDLVWTPTPKIVYPPGHQTTISLGAVTKPLEGASRPGHFDGVATVVSVLFNVFQPTRAYFGQKDAQQVAVIRQMVGDLHLNLEIVACPIIRESDGLAMSSRNRRLSPDERQAAIILHRALSAARNVWEQGEHNANRLRGLMISTIQSETLARIDYVSAADPITLVEIDGEAEHLLLSMAVFIGDIRLIDNMTVGL